VGEDDAPVGTEGVVEHAQDAHAELVDPRPFEDGAAGPFHSRVDLLQGQDLTGPGGSGGEAEGEEKRAEGAERHIKNAC
jgi:hypothetical protein